MDLLDIRRKNIVDFLGISGDNIEKFYKVLSSEYELPSLNKIPKIFLSPYWEYRVSEEWFIYYISDLYYKSQDELIHYLFRDNFKNSKGCLILEIGGVGDIFYEIQRSKRATCYSYMINILCKEFLAYRIASAEIHSRQNIALPYGMLENQMIFDPITTMQFDASFDIIILGGHLSILSEPHKVFLFSGPFNKLIMKGTKVMLKPEVRSSLSEMFITSGDYEIIEEDVYEYKGNKR